VSDGNLKLTASADFGKLSNSFDRLSKKVNKQEEQLRRMGDASGKATKKGETGMRGMISTGVRLISTYVGIHSAIATVNAALQEEIQLRQKAAGSQTSLQEQRILFNTQTGRFTPEQRQRFEERIQVSGIRAGLTEAEALEVGRRALTATSDSDVDKRIEKAAGIVDIMSKALGPVLHKFGGGLPGAILDLQRTLGGSREQAAGFATTALDISRTEDIEQLPNLIRTIAGASAVQSQLDPDKRLELAKQTLALFSAIQSSTGDVVGANTSTAISNFIAVLSEKAGDRTLLPEELINALQGEEGIKFKGKSFTRPVQQDLFRNESTLNDLFRDNLEAVSGNFEQQFQTIVDLNTGKNDPDIAGTRASAALKSQAAAARRVRLGLGQEVTNGFVEALTESRPGPSAFAGRNLTRLALKFSPTQVEDEQAVARIALKSAIANRDLEGLRTNQSPLGLLFARRNRIRSVEGTDAELLERARAAGTPESAQAIAMFEEIRKVIDAIGNESASRQADNAALTDTVSRGVNSAVASGRTTREQEN
jgi:hypothetical protein